MQAPPTEAGFMAWRPGELEIFRQLPEISCSEFAETHRTVTIGAHRGKWSNEITPYLTSIMDTSDLPWVHTLVIVGPEQSGKTNACINIHLKDLVYNGGNAKFIMFPTENLAKTVATSRLLPIYEQCEPIRSKFTSNPDDRAAGKISLRDGTIIFPAWATSAAKLSSFPSDFTWGDEVDKNNDLTGDESDALKLLEKRTRTFRSYLNLICSTPTLESGHVWRALTDCADIRDYYAVCPVCQGLQIMKEERLTWPGQLALTAAVSPADAAIAQPDADPKQIEQGRLARYVCEECAARWDDLDRNRAVRAGAWVSRENLERPASVGFHITGFICPDISLSEIAAKIIQGKSGDVSAERERDNSYLGIPHRPKQGAERKEDSILKLKDDRPEGLVPSVPIAAITGVFDMQKRGFYFSVRAWGYGLEQESWLLKHGYVDSWAALKTILWDSEFKDISGKPYHITLRGGDSGGGESAEFADLSRTAEAYIFAAQNPGLLLFKGARRAQSNYSVRDLDRIPGTNRALPGSAKLYTLNVTTYKDRLAAKLQVSPIDPGAWHLHQEVDESFARQMCSEYKAGLYWECPKGRPNHLWDCSTYEMALVDIAQVKYWAQKVEPQQEEHSQPRTQKQRRW